MDFIKPKYVNVEAVEYRLSEKARSVIKHYSEYIGITESQVIEEMTQHLLRDQDFLFYIEGIRNNKRIKKDLGLLDDENYKTTEFL